MQPPGGPWHVCSSEAGRASEDIGLDAAPAWQSQLGELRPWLSAVSSAEGLILILQSRKS